jgi:hypothetical protein
MNKSLHKILCASALSTLALPAYAGQPAIQHYRGYDQKAVNVFETYKDDGVPFTELEVRIGGSFTQQFQAIEHQNSGLVALKDIGKGFNLATANLNIDVQLEDGIHMNLITYLSSKHHNEAWVKGGFIQIDSLKMWDNAFFDAIMEHASVKIGHMEINYGDMHFRRSDNGNTTQNPFVGNLIMDAFATEAGVEVTGYAGDFFGIFAVTDGEIRAGITEPENRSPSYIGKIGFDRQINPDLRFRITGSVYYTRSSISNTLYGGDRTGSRYDWVMEPATKTDLKASAFTGRFNPGFKDHVAAFVINPFIKYKGLEIMGNYETARGRSSTETSRTWNQYSLEVVYRFLKDESVYVGFRDNVVTGELPTLRTDVSISRGQLVAGWFITPNMLLKAEYVAQFYHDFPTNYNSGQFSGGKFHGFIVEAAVGF